MSAVPKLRAVTPVDAARDRDQAFRTWLVNVPTAYLECRNGHHVFPGITDVNTELSVHQGVVLADARCPRCGTVLHKLLGAEDGYIVGTSRQSYVYPEGYLLPREACDGAAMSRERRGEVRLELLARAYARKGRSFSAALAADKRKTRNAAARAAKKAKRARG